MLQHQLTFTHVLAPFTVAHVQHFTSPGDAGPLDPRCSALGPTTCTTGNPMPAVTARAHEPTARPERRADEVHRLFISIFVIAFVALLSAALGKHAILAVRTHCEG